MESKPGRIESAILNNINQSKNQRLEGQSETTDLLLEQLSQAKEKGFTDFPADRVQIGLKTYTLHEVRLLLDVDLELKRIAEKHGASIESEIRKAVRQYIVGQNLLEQTGDNF